MSGRPDLAEVVLKAARQERQNGSGTDNDDRGNAGKARAADEASPKGSRDRGSDAGNGHLLPPKDWHQQAGPANDSAARVMTSSPEPLSRPTSHASVHSTDYVNAKASGSGSGSGTATPRKLSTVSRQTSDASTSIASRLIQPRPKQRSTASTSTSAAHKRGASFYGSRHHNLTSESSASSPVATAHNRTAGPSQFASVKGKHASTTPSETVPEDSAEGDAHPARGQAGEDSEKGGAGPLRGPFSRLDSSRGQSKLAANKRQTDSRQASGSSQDASYRPSRRSTSDSYAAESSTKPRSRRGSFSSRLARSVGFGTADQSTREDDEHYESPQEMRADAAGQNGVETLSGGETEAPNQSLERPAELQHSTSSPEMSRHTSRQDDSARPRVGMRGLTFGNIRRGSDEQLENGDSDSRARKAGAKKPDGPKRPTARSRWTNLRDRIRAEKRPEELDKSLTGKELVTDLSTGLMSVMMLKMAFDRDEHDQHRIPVLLNYLKLRITDSVYPFHDTHAIFRIELEYGDGLLKWVIYRELRDFVNLHAHYRVANVAHGLNKFPGFPRTSIPYFNKLTKELREKGEADPGKAEFAKTQRQSLEDYLLRLIRSVMFRPEANRLCKFLELSAISIHLAARGGLQGKQGYLRVMSGGASRHRKPGFHPLDFKQRHEPKWFVVRDSYILAVDEPYATPIWDVFYFDSDFSIERPRRLYRQGLGLLKDAQNKGDDDDGELPESLGQRRYEGMEGFNGGNVGDPNDPSTSSLAKDDPKYLQNTSLHTFYLKNSERKIKLVAKTQRQMDQFIASIEKIAAKSIWAGQNRFGSFAPIRLNVAAQWLVDGRDYFWNLSRAILLAKERIYIHDWWLSPELYLRRPPASNGRWRLDRLLKKKAEEGVQIFIIVYQEVSNDFTPVDSGYTKHSLTKLHPNIMVQRSPSHAQTRTLLWSHHEKMCVIDETIAFMGGLDLCFGRWDTPAHVMNDDGPAMKDDLDMPDHGKTSGEVQESQVWPGKDYANSRVSDYYGLHKPFEDMYDRKKTPREPWHDIGLQIIGQPARDLCRHFIQRWNLLLRMKNHKRFMPFLLPPPDFSARELDKLQLTGTCEAQICRSVGPWSMGTPNRIEASIQQAYIKAIQLSEHFVYIENQFFITSTEVVGTQIENNIGNALVERILRAHEEDTAWRAIIVMPLEPGYPMPVDHPDAGSVRLIMACQYRSICRGESSIFARLRRAGVDPNDYISFFSLRSWTKMQDGTLATSDIYIHAKCMIVDDRTALIGSANINERSQRGDRDSELLCVVRDTDMVQSTMAGKPFKVGRFAHTLRIRLMREHLGIDVDALEAEEAAMDLMNREPVKDADDVKVWDPDHETRPHSKSFSSEKGHRTRAVEKAKEGESLVSEAFTGLKESIQIGADKAVPGVSESVAAVAGPGGVKEGEDTAETESGRATDGDRIVQGREKGRVQNVSAVVPTLEEKTIHEFPTVDDKHNATPMSGDAPLRDTRQLPTSSHSPTSPPMSAQPSDIDATQSPKQSAATLVSNKRKADDGRRPPGHRRFDSNATATSTQGTISNGKSNEQVANSNKVTDTIRKGLAGKMNAYSIPTKAPKIDPHGFADPLSESFYKNVWQAAAVRNTQIYRKVFRCTPDDLVTTWAMLKEWSAWQKRHEKSARGPATSRTTDNASSSDPSVTAEDPERMHAKSPTNDGPNEAEKRKKGKQQLEEPFSEDEIEQMQALLEEVTGHLVVFPTRYLESESAGQNFLWSKDRIPPIAIYN